MLEIKNLNIQYDNKIIYENAHFQAQKYQLTVIIGESGSGKSTLHEILTLQKYANCEYTYNEKYLNLLSPIDKQKFIKNNIGIVKQYPQFINDLKIKDHISLIQSICNGYNIDCIAKNLNITHTFNLYPQQLSGGEKMRVSIFLSLIRQPDILILDEPTASLDQKHSSEILNLLKEYAQQGHIVIIFTHDINIRDNADTLYKIHNKKLINQYTSLNNNHITKHLHSIAKTKHYLHYIIKMLKHDFLIKSFMIIFLSIAIGICSFSILYGQSNINFYKSKLDNLDKGGIFYKENDINNPFLLRFISNEEIKDLHEISYINIWKYYYQHHIPSIHYNQKISIFNHNQKEYSRQILDTNYVTASYNQDFNYQTNYVEKKFNNSNGIHISLSLLYYIKTGNEFNIYEIGESNLKNIYQDLDNNSTIELPISIPLYRTIDNGIEKIHYETITIKSKISSIYNNSQHLSMGDNEFLDPDIFIPLNLIEKYQKELSKKIPHNSHPLLPIYYQFSVSNQYNFSKAKETIESYGFKVCSYYDNALSQIEIIKAFNKGINTISQIILLIVLLLFYGIKYNQKRDYIDFINYFTQFGISHKYAKKILTFYLLYESIIISLLSIITMLILAYVFLVVLFNSIFIIKFEYILLCLFLSISINLIIPMLIIKRGDNK